MGHASRCVPIIKQLLLHNFTPIIASDGSALKFLQKEFPQLKTYQLPSYNLRYAENKLFFNIYLCAQAPHIWKTVALERRKIAEIIKKEKAIGIISDNRFGAYSKEIPSVYITHQLTVFSGITTALTSYFHQKIIQKFDICWVPDNDKMKISGKLSQSKRTLNTKYIGILSRFKKEELPIKNEILVILSGPEPQRTVLEKILISQLKKQQKNTLLVRGLVSDQNKSIQISDNFQAIDFLLSKELEKEINQSNLLICRAGYSSIMDLYVLNKKALLIPTPKQKEQEYLAKYLHEEKIFTSIKQSQLSQRNIFDTLLFEQKTQVIEETDFGKLFQIFPKSTP